jgi:hypothetical protein
MNCGGPLHSNLAVCFSNGEIKMQVAMIENMISGVRTPFAM